MRYGWSGVIAGCAVLGVSLWAELPREAAAQSVADFYRGKQINVIVSANNGGGYDIYARALAPYYGHHIPGQPTVVVQDMPGAGGILATNYIYNTAPKDGTVVGMVTSAMTTASVLTVTNARFNTSKINWIGNIEEEAAQCVSWQTSPIKTTTDMLSKEFIVGTTGVGSSFEIYPRVINEFLGAKLKVISGYKGGDEVAIAMERGEIHGLCGWDMSSIRTMRADWFSGNKLHFLLQIGIEKDPALPDTPLITEFVKSDDDLAALNLIFVARSLLRPVLAPPDVPAERIEALRDAFMETMKDEAFLAYTVRAGLVVSPVNGRTVQDIITKMNETPKPVVQRAIKAMGTCASCITE